MHKALAVASFQLFYSDVCEPELIQYGWGWTSLFKNLSDSWTPITIIEFPHE